MLLPPGAAPGGAPAGSRDRRSRPALARADRQRPDHARAAVGGELRRDRAAVLLHDLAADVQPQPEAGLVAVHMRAVEPLEQATTALEWDARTVVAHHQADLLARRLELQPDLGVVRGVLD